MRPRSASSRTASPALTVNVVLIVPLGKDAHEVQQVASSYFKFLRDKSDRVHLDAMLDAEERTQALEILPVDERARLGRPPRFLAEHTPASLDINIPAVDLPEEISSEPVSTARDSGASGDQTVRCCRKPWRSASRTQDLYLRV